MPAETVAAVWLLPFGLLLLAIAVLPLVAHRFWERNRNKALVAAALALPVVLWAREAAPGALQTSLHEYLSFMLLLGTLFVVSGGLHLEGDLRATPLVNATFLLAGAVLANVVGTTGASLVLIRPLLVTNSERRHVVHTVIFFMFMACNTGGCLTPLGDPPLLVGFLRGVPFTWTLGLWPAWLGLNAALLAVYVAWDSLAVRRETAAAVRRDRAMVVPLRLRGLVNLPLLVAVLPVVAYAGFGTREVLLLAVAALSLLLTPRAVHRSNAFGWGPLLEVAVLFAGLFVTMVPALQYLYAHGAELGVRTPLEFFWATGLLSSVLDNTPTYLALLSLAQGLDLPQEVVGVSHGVLAGISLGAVFLGAATYIGNGPNFMVKAIAVERGVRMPGFFGYLLYSVPVLLPLCALVAWLFLGGA
jgi:Na+/H+ antiporter NhaD/arsenite permease-like protein